MLSKHLPLYDKAFNNDLAFWKSTSPSDLLKQKTLPLLAVAQLKEKITLHTSERIR
jgi:hypothetical protein